VVFYIFESSGHCKKLAPIYSEAATKLLNNNPSIKIAKVNCDFEKKLCEKYKIGSFPTIKYIQNGKMEEFIAERSVDSIVETVKRFNKAVIDDSSDIENDVVVDDSDVVVLKEDTFDQFIVDNVITVIKFYGKIIVIILAPWCGHCKALKAPYDNAATILLKSEPPIKIAKVDCTTQQSLCSTHKIDGYPTLKVFRNGNCN
jgi:thioredoxin domain-containing protein 5